MNSELLPDKVTMLEVGALEQEDSHESGSALCILKIDNVCQAYIDRRKNRNIYDGFLGSIQGNLSSQYPYLCTEQISETSLLSAYFTGPLVVGDSS